MASSNPDPMRTPVCEAIGIDYPVLQAGMGMIAQAELAAAVSEAGGLGVIGTGLSMRPDELREQIQIVRSTTSKPFGVDILFATVRAKGGSVATYTDNVQGLIRVTLEEQVPVLISGLGSPKGAVPEAHERGIYVMSVIGAERHAIKAASDGVDAVIASGRDGGGHVGEVGTAALVPSVVAAVDVPVIAAGGLADGPGLAAALMWGAQGVWLGTRFIATEEAGAHRNYKAKIVDTGSSGTVVTRAHSGKPCRMIRNAFTDHWAEREAEIQPYPRQALEVGNPASTRGRLEGDAERGVLPAGQSVGVIRAVEPAGDVVRNMVSQARAAIAAAASL
jgi:enoyl-[acyl-carrier protein] reductase II